ncbi:uncharacterized protein K460DRAFT_413805 [Cucurbitaria berberidis CBS 394.84]|uniref:Mid2 domain-containing protein n=1 Tax=Cucurbitaria berberidis CBS 394.84 TaxID=1168544 RepID=A0A9P4GJY1_9PLEO|nr:uncharacterized protein K460DRAFT_413805 [Cucurbitaria berberidis CBS 394.84]KAF1846992.1 hypothetical protein K460DRAFT_413805 [Cucurbitaria berberidis CBS 394.84]
MTLAQRSPCYFANGTVLPDEEFYNSYQPCTSGGPPTICCAFDRPNPAGGIRDTVDECLPNGLCQNRAGDATTWWANFCTSSGIEFGKCITACRSTKDKYGHTQLTPCTGKADSDRWCCGANNPTCCADESRVVRLAQVLGGALSSSMVSSSVVSSASATASSVSGAAPSTTATSVAPGQTEKKTKLSGGAIAGIVLGAIAGLTILAGIFVAQRARYKNKASTSGTSNHVETPTNPYIPQEYVGPGPEGYATQYAPPAELPPVSPRELHSGNHMSLAPPFP